MRQWWKRYFMLRPCYFEFPCRLVSRTIMSLNIEWSVEGAVQCYSSCATRYRLFCSIYWVCICDCAGNEGSILTYVSLFDLKVLKHECEGGKDLNLFLVALFKHSTVNSYGYNTVILWLIRMYSLNQLNVKVEGTLRSIPPCFLCTIIPLPQFTCNAVESNESMCSFNFQLWNFRYLSVVLDKDVRKFWMVPEASGGNPLP